MGLIGEMARDKIPAEAERQAALAVCGVAAGLHDCRGARCRSRNHQRDREAARAVLAVLGLVRETP